MTTVLGTQLFILFMVSPFLALNTFGSLMTCSVFSLVIILSLIPTFIVYCQHLHVVCWTIPWVLRQPVIPNLTNDTDHLEIAITSREDVYVRAHNSGSGLEIQKTGKIRFHVLSSNATSNIHLARIFSIFFAVMTFFMMIWATLVFIGSLILARKAD